MIPAVTLSLAEARRIALRAQGLGEETAPFGTGKAAALLAVRHLGYVQVDTVNVIQRAHHHVLWSRVPDYTPEMLHALQGEDFALFEYWNHAASYLPMEDYRFSLPLMRKYRKQYHWCDGSPEMEKAMRRMARMVRDKGPLRISDVESGGTIREWGGSVFGKIERRALHELWMRGQVMIRSRHGFEKVFDIPGRILPATTDRKVPTRAGAAEFHVRRGLRALGIARTPELHYLHDAGRAGDIRAALARLVKSGEVIEVRIAEFPGIPHYAFPSALEQTAPLRARHVRFLSPFDNLVIQRKRLKWMFNFDYTVEMYLPPAKRKYGYFALPVLWGERFIGRLDAKALRSERRLLIHSLHFEPGFADWKSAKPSFLEALRAFCKFQQCDDWKITRVEPGGFRV